MVKLVLGLVVMPTAALTLFSAAKSLGLVVTRASSSGPFVAGFSLAAALWALGRCAAEGSTSFGLSAVEGLSRRLYIFGHELTHALAAWACGHRVLGFKVGESGGHVDLSQSNAFVALAPYCLPVYTVLVVAGYRALLFAFPEAGGQSAFLALIGVTLAFHALKTFEVLWDRRQPDLAAAGGAVFSLSFIGLANGLALIALLKVLFPRAVPLGGELRGVAAHTERFWRASWAFVRPVSASFVAQMRKS